jgi:hypothetical protein
MRKTVMGFVLAAALLMPAVSIAAPVRPERAERVVSVWQTVLHWLGSLVQTSPGGGGQGATPAASSIIDPYG